MGSSEESATDFSLLNIPPFSAVPCVCHILLLPRGENSSDDPSIAFDQFLQLPFIGSFLFFAHVVQSFQPTKLASIRLLGLSWLQWYTGTSFSAQGVFQPDGNILLRRWELVSLGLLPVYYSGNTGKLLTRTHVVSCVCE